MHILAIHTIQATAAHLPDEAVSGLQQQTSEEQGQCTAGETCAAAAADTEQPNTALPGEPVEDVEALIEWVKQHGGEVGERGLP